MVTDRWPLWAHVVLFAITWTICGYALAGWLGGQ